MNFLIKWIMIIISGKFIFRFIFNELFERILTHHLIGKFRCQLNWKYTQIQYTSYILSNGAGIFMFTNTFITPPRSDTLAY